MPTTSKAAQNHVVKQAINPYWVAGCRVNVSNPGYNLPSRIEDIIVGASWLDSNGSKPLVNPNKLLMILATQDVISVASILSAFGEQKGAIILKTLGINERQARRYAAAARVASNELLALIEARRLITEEDFDVE